MRLELHERERDDAIVTLAASLPASDAAVEVRYATRTGALARIDGAIAGAFDREHHAVVLAPCERERELTLEVERFALPTNGLPSRPDIRWTLMLRRGHERPQRYVDVRAFDAVPANGRATAHQELPLWGHSHLDVAWLWAYSDTKRKALRTFANALDLIERDPSFVFMQSQPQLYAFVENGDATLFGRVRERVREGRFSAQPAALWVEPDCNLISGESLLRQMIFAHRYCSDRFGLEPSIAWLPDTFGFPNTLPTLLAHGGIRYFATTKLQWNDTHRFPFTRFRWIGPDGSAVVSGMLDAYEGGPDAPRVLRARERREPLVIGYGDGGGGPTASQVHAAQAVGEWQPPQRWFERIEADALPEYRDELYLEYHRGTYTTHHDVKANNAMLERELAAAEERLAWCVAVRAPHDVMERLFPMLHEAWEIVLRNQFHDVLPGTSVRAAYVESLDEYARARELVEAVRKSCEAMLPRAARQDDDVEVRPSVDGDDVILDNGLVHARLNRKGALLELRTANGRNAVAQANLLAAYRDRPKKWEAWNLDAGYQKKRVPVRPAEGEVESDGLIARFDAAGSPLEMRVSLRAGEPFLRVDCAVDWRSEQIVLRLENWLTVASDRVLYGAPHGTIERVSGDPAKYEVPGQRFASAGDSKSGIALLTLDTYGWSARNLRRGGMQLGHSLLRSPRWPDPQSDRGEARLSWGFAPLDDRAPSTLEHLWEAFALPKRVRLFVPSARNVVVTAVKRAEDGDGLIVRVRECDGAGGEIRLRCGARMREVSAVDALERPVEAGAAIVAEEIVTTVPAFGLRSLRVRF